MLTSAKKQKMLVALKNYRKQYLDGKISELDESGTRIMINSFLSDVLGYKQLEEIKTEYMIKSTYADYVIQVNKNRYFLVEVKALSLNLSEKHLRQTINYGANEGIEYALLTNGKTFEFYKVIFDKPISQRLIFSVDVSDVNQLKANLDLLQHLHRESVVKNNFRPIWNKCEAYDPYNISGIICSQPVIKMIGKLIKQKFNEKCSEESILCAMNKIISEKMDLTLVKQYKVTKQKVARVSKQKPIESLPQINEEPVTAE